MANTNPERVNIAEEVTVRKQELLEALRANRENHRKEFEEALDGWEIEAKERLTKLKADLSKGKRFALYVSMPLPEDHTRDYDREIKKLEMHVDDHVTIPTQEFSQYVMDDWHWKQQWSTSNSAYQSISNTRGKFSQR